MAATTTTITKLSLITVTLIAFAGIVAGQNPNRRTNSTTEIFESEDTTRVRYLKNETTDGHRIRTPPTVYSTVQATHFTTAEPKAVTFKQETSSKPKPVVKIRPRSSTTTVQTAIVPNVTVSSNVPNETDQTTIATTPGEISNNSSEGNLNTVRKYQLKDVTTTIETVSSTQATKPTEVTKSDPLKKFSLPRERKPETTLTPRISTEETTFFHKPENSTFSTEGRDIKKDPIEQELDDTINSMPKLPELALSNDTHFEFYQDPEEASLDERITQIARQLAETGLRREYEERKLGHFIPISVRPIEYITPSYHSKSKSIKFVKTETQDFRPPRYKSTLLKVLTKTKSDPENLDKNAYELVTNLPEILRRNKSDKQIREMNGLIKVGGKGFNTDSTDMFPTNFPVFFELLQTSEKGNSGTEMKSEPQSVATTTEGKDLTTRGRRLTDDTTYYAYIETTDNS